TFNIRLNSEPTADVTVPFASTDATACAVGVPSAAFTAENWDVVQSTTVSAVDDDAVNDPPRVCGVASGPATSTDPKYQGLDAADIEVIVLDDDAPGFIVEPVALTLAESGSASSDDFTVRLTSE